MNIRLLRKIAEHIAEEPRRFVMGSYLQQDEEEVVEFSPVEGRIQWPSPRCGTAGCIAGWACVLTGNPDTHDFPTDAGRELEIDDPQQYRLFALDGWPNKFRLKFVNGKTPATRAKVAVARIEHFIKTKGEE